MPSESVLAPVSTRRRPLLLGIAAALAVLVAIVVALTARREGSRPPAVATVARSVVVIPFDAAADDEAARLGYGLADEISRTLSRVPGLRVARMTRALPRSHNDTRLGELGELLNVGAILHGVARLAGREIRLTVTLRSADVDSTLWRAEYARDTLALQSLRDEIAVAVADTLRAELGLQPLAVAKLPTIDPRAHLLALRAASPRDRGDRQSMDTAIALLRAAVARDSTHARLWSDLATLVAARSDSVSRDSAARRESVRLARRAIRLDDRLAEPHVVLARAHEAASNPAEAAREYLTAIRLDPLLASARYGYSRLLADGGRLDEALREARRAFELDPLAADAHLNYARMLARAGQSADAKRELAEQRRIASYLRSHQ